MNLEISKRSYDFVSKLQAKQFRQIMLKVLSLLKDPFPNDSQKLKGHDFYHRVDIGEYRIIYQLEKETVKIDLIDKRNDDQVYKKLRNLGH